MVADEFNKTPEVFIDLLRTGKTFVGYPDGAGEE
jgi:hypothetical protein